MAAQRVDRLGPLTHQQIACPEQHPPTLLLRRLDRHKIHRRARRCLADRLSVRRIVLLTLDVRLDILRRDQPHRMAQIADLPAPVMSAGAGLHRHRAARLRCQKFQYFPAAQLLAERNRSIGPRAVQLKAVLRQINSDHANLVHGRPFPLLALTPLPTWHIAMPLGGASTPSLTIIEKICIRFDDGIRKNSENDLVEPLILSRLQSIIDFLSKYGLLTAAGPDRQLLFRPGLRLSALPRCLH